MRGWGRSWDDLYETCFVFWLAEFVTSSQIPDISDFLSDARPTELGGDPTTIMEGVAASVEEHGWVKLVRTLGGLPATGARLTSVGQVHVRRLRTQRADGAARRVACREALLCWLYNEQEVLGVKSPSLNGFAKDPRGWFVGQAFSEDEVDRAAKFLKEARLVSGIGALGKPLLRANLLPAGIECVRQCDGAVETFLNRQRQSTGGTTIHVQGDNNAVAANSPQAQQTIVAIANQLDLEELRRFAQGVKEALPLLKDLTEEDQSQATELVDQINTELAADKPDRKRLARLGAALRDIVTNAAGGVLGQLLLQSAPAALQLVKDVF
jgi:microcompartment protein CcmL/EutN